MSSQEVILVSGSRITFGTSDGGTVKISPEGSKPVSRQYAEMVVRTMKGRVSIKEIEPVPETAPEAPKAPPVVEQTKEPDPAPEAPKVENEASKVEAPAAPDLQAPAPEGAAEKDEEQPDEKPAGKTEQEAKPAASAKAHTGKGKGHAKTAKAASGQQE